MSPPEEGKSSAAAAMDETVAADEPVEPAADGDGTGEPPNPEDDALDAKRMSLLEHLSELRVRLRNAAIAFLVALIISFFFVQRFFAILVRPVCRGLEKAGHECAFNFMGVTEPFWIYMKLAIVAGLMIAAPFVFWELWKFVAPGLYKKEKKLAGAVTGATALCFAAGGLFGYSVLAEPAAYFMVKLAEAPGVTINPMLSMELVGSFLMLMLAGCGAAFELPVVLSILGWVGIVSAKGLWKFNKYALVLSCVAGAVLTPSTDPYTQLLLAGPLYALYNFSILVVLGIERARKRQLEELEKEYKDQDKDL